MVFQNNILAGVGGQVTDAAYEVDNSCRFNDNDAAKLSLTFTGSPTSDRIGTFAFWFKRGHLSDAGTILSQTSPDDGAMDTIYVQLIAADTLHVSMEDGTSQVILRATKAVFRDPGAWYHLVIAIDGTQTNINCMRIYINGKEYSDWDTGSYPNKNLTSSTDLNLGSGTNPWTVGTLARYTSGTHYDGYLSQFAYIDGLQLGPESFGEFNNGVWRPIDITGLTYGNNGWLFDFADSSDLGNDISGNNNDFTSSGLTTADRMVDTPTNNYCTFSILNEYTTGSADGSLDWVSSTDGAQSNGTIFFDSSDTTGFYFEYIPVDAPSTTAGAWSIGIMDIAGVADGIANLGTYAGLYVFDVGDGAIQGGGGSRILNGAWDSQSNGGMSLGETLQVAVKAGKIYFGVDDTWYDSSDGSFANAGEAFTVTDGFYAPSGRFANTSSGTHRLNCGNNGSYAFTKPTGLKDISTSNLTEATVKDGRKYFDTIVYEGNGSGQKVGQFQPITETYSIDDSMMLDKASGQYLTRTPSEDGNLRTWTFSTWFKPVLSGDDQYLLSCWAASGAADLFYIYIGSVGEFRVGASTSSSTVCEFKTDREFHDTSQWINFIFAIDTTQGTEADRVHIYINGVEETSFSTETQPAENADTSMNGQFPHNIGASGYSAAPGYSNGYWADTVMIDGLQLTASSFGEVDSTTNRWIPKDVSGLTFGTNGFYLDYADKNDLGDDESGNTNDFTETSMDTTNGSNQFHDTPTRNFVTGDTSQKGSGVTVSNGGLTSTADGSGSEGIRATNLNESRNHPQSGKWYFEYLIDVIDAVQAQPNLMPFIWEEADLTDTSLTGAELGNHIEFSQFSNMRARIGGVDFDYDDFFTDLAVGDVVGFAIDADTNRIFVSLNDTWSSLTGDPDASGAGIGYPFSSYRGTYGMVKHYGGSKCTMNYGQWEYFDGTTLTEDTDAKGYFRYTPPSGYLALNNDNLTETDSFQTAFSWTKNRDAADGHRLFDRVRGRFKELSSDSTGIEGTDTNSLQRFLKQGQLIGSTNEMNTSMESFVSWDWFIETTGSGSTLETGSIDSECLVDTTSGFSVVTWTGSGANANIGHGLGVVPKFIIIKNLLSTNTWPVYHEGIGATKSLELNSNAAEAAGLFQDTTPTSTVFYVDGSNNVNQLDKTMLAYCFAEIEGFSAFGSYEGNNDADGPLIYTGFAPAWICCKNIDSAVGGNWWTVDSARDPYNPADKELILDGTSAEDVDSSAIMLDFLSNGFKMRAGGSAANSSNTFIYMAFASNPFGGASTTPATAF